MSIQGLLCVFVRRRVLSGALSLRKLPHVPVCSNCPQVLACCGSGFYTARAAKREKEILECSDGVIGRTRWDCAHVLAFKPAGPVLPCGRDNATKLFTKDSGLSDRLCERHTLIYTNAGHPSRGIENILARDVSVMSGLPNDKTQTCGYGKRAKWLCTLSEAKNRGSSGWKCAVENTGFLDEAQMTEVLLRAHVFVIASYIENSPNSLSEAMLLGLPCVAGYTGGIPDLVSLE